jgi:pimeloyl-ACP methyl ester carboxylesterase
VRDIIVAQHEQFGKTVVLLGHSKGGTDAAAACAMYWAELKDKVRGLIMLQSPYGGTPLAADLLHGGQFGALNSVFLGKLASFSNPDVSYSFITIHLLYVAVQLRSGFKGSFVNVEFVGDGDSLWLCCRELLKLLKT